MSNDSIKERLATLEEQVHEISTNHLPHLQKAIEKVDSKLWYIASGVIISILTQLSLKFL